MTAELTDQFGRTSADVLGRQHVRQFGVPDVHLVDVEKPVGTVVVGTLHWTAGFRPAICGEQVYDGVILAEAVTVTCRRCRELNAKGL